MFIAIFNCDASISSRRHACTLFFFLINFFFFSNEGYKKLLWVFVRFLLTSLCLQTSMAKNRLKAHCSMSKVIKSRAVGFFSCSPNIPRWVYPRRLTHRKCSLLLTEIVHTLNLFPDDDPGSVIPKHYRRVEIKYSKLGEKGLDFWLENLGLLSYKSLVCVMWQKYLR